MAAVPTRPALRYHGGKWMLAPWIIGFFPPHRVYTEAFGGAASVLFRKPRAKLVEVYNDADGEIVNVFRVLRDYSKGERLAKWLKLTPFARAEFEESYRHDDFDIEQARRTIVRSFMGFGSDSASGATTGFRGNGNRQTAHPAKDWSNYPAEIIRFTARLEGVVLENRDALDIIRQHDEPAALHYCDPPYPHGTRSTASVRTGKGYRHEMTDDDHRALAEVLRSATGMVVLSGYACDLYDRELYPDWDRHERPALADGGRERTEIVWLNAACSAALGSPAQQSLIEQYP
jgi:DNA adenine methylase